MSIDQIIGIIGQIAAWITILLVFFTMREMEKQRKASQKPELIVPNVSIFGYTNDNEIFIATHWSNKELKNDSYILGELPKVVIYNIGAGAAKEIKIKWDFDLKSTLQTIQDYCYKNSIPVVVDSQNGFLTIEFIGNESHSNIDAFANIEQPFIMPVSINSLGFEADLPLTFLNLVSILVFLKIHQSNMIIGEKGEFHVSKYSFEIPPLYFELHYGDIGGNRYKKKFDVKFKILMSRYPLIKFDNSSNNPIFLGMFEFKEKR